jgi:lysophospholipase L1-like esterase
MAHRRALAVACLVVLGCGDGESDMTGTGGSGGDAQGSGGRGGTTGSAGASGTAGTVGTGGAGGTSGTAGTGTSGSAGQGGGAGVTTGGNSGTGGATGAAGRGGTGGATGGATAGTGGVSGRGGASGSGGRGGATGGGGAGGAAGRGGATGGTGGAAGAAGTGVAGLEAAGVRWFGRADISDATQPRFSWSGTGFIARFSGTGLTARLNNSGAFIFKPVVDGTPKATFTSTSGTANYDLATGLTAGTHTVELYRQTEGGQGNSQLVSLTVGGGGSLMAPPAGPGRLIEVVGDSISAGYGTLGTLSDSDCYPTESHWDTYESIAARAVGAEVSTIAASGQGMYRNYGGDMNNTLPKIYGRTLMNDTASAWGFSIQPQAVIINLGTNDISNGKGDPGTPFRDAYNAFVQMVRAKYPSAFIICMIGPLLSGTDLTTIQGHLQAVVQARKTAGDTKIEYFGDIAAQTSDKAACQYHPNPAENMIMGTQLAAELRARLGW